VGGQAIEGKEHMTKDEALRLALEALKSNRRTHHYCEDTWYSCPKHEDGCANDSEGDECNCGADEANAGIDEAITAIKAALEAKDEPVKAWCETCEGGGKVYQEHQAGCWVGGEHACPDCDGNGYYTTPSQRKPLTDEEVNEFFQGMEPNNGFWLSFARAIEAAHGIKE
jgi:RecJ-like exonuclease